MDVAGISPAGAPCRARPARLHASAVQPDDHERARARRQTLYALGAPMRRVIPLVPIFANHAVGFAVVSYDGEVVVQA